MNILFVTQFFYPENFRINDLAFRLVERGNNVTVLTGMPNYPQGEFYPGYSNEGPREEEINGVKIIRVPIVPRKTGSLRLCLNYLSFIISGCSMAGKICKTTNFDAIYAFGTSPITQALPAITIRKKKSTPVILNVQDLWPDNVVAITGIKSKLAIKAIDVLVDYIYNRCDYIYGTSEAFVSAIRERKGLKDKNKVKYWPQYSVVNASEDKRYDLMEDGKFHVAFTGNVGEGQGLDLVVEAAQMLSDTNVVFDIFGDGRAKESLENEVSKRGLSERVIFHGSFPENEIPAILNTAGAALLILKPDPIFYRTIPAKLQTYLACGCAVIGCVQGEAARVISDSQGGFVTKEISAKELAKTAGEIAKLSPDELSSMRENSRKYSNEYFDANKLISSIEEDMKNLCKSGTDRG